MSSTAKTETKDDSTTPNDTTIKPKTTKKKKKKKNTILYQETAVKYFDGFMKNKRYNKGINLSTACSIFKTAWELPENNGLILPSRVLRHFKQVLPKKPKQNKKKKKKTNNTKSNVNNKTVTNTENNIEPTPTNEEEENTELMRARTMVNIKGINELNLNFASPTNDYNLFRRSMNPTTIVSIDKQTKTERKFDDNIEDAIDHNIYDDSTTTINHSKQMSYSSNNLQSHIQYNINTPPINAHARLSTTLTSSDTPITPDPEVITADNYVDHADITKDDMKPDVEETPMLKNRAETDIQNMHHDLVSFKIEILKEEKKEKQDIIIEEKETKKDSKSKPPTKKKKKKKNPILYAEDATRLFKKISDGKRLKNGITLKKACKIFGVAWELPEENGRLLPSKVARHFKQVLPSKKNKLKNKNKNIKPSVAKSRTHRDKITVNSIENESENATGNSVTTKPRSNTMRGHLNVMNGLGHNIIRSSNQLPSVRHIMNSNYNKPKKSIIADLESLITSDPNRINSSNNNDERIKVKRKKAGSLTDLELNGLVVNVNDDDEHEEDQIVENEIEALFKEKKKEKEKENDLINAIELGL